MRSSSQYLALGGGLAWTNENYTDAALPTKNSTEAYLGTEFMTEKLKITDLITRLTYYPSLTIDHRYRLTYRFDLDFNLPGDWYFRIGLFELRQRAAGRDFRITTTAGRTRSASNSEPQASTPYGDTHPAWNAAVHIRSSRYGTSRRRRQLSAFRDEPTPGSGDML